MNTKELKVLRGQIRQIVKELLPEVLGAELIQALERKLSDELKQALERIDERQKSLQAYMVRSSVKSDPSKE